MLHGPIPSASALSKDIEIVAVEMHGMRSGEVVLQDNSYRGIGAEIEDIPLRVVGIGGVALIGEDENRVADVIVRKVKGRKSLYNLLIVCTE